MQHLTFQLRRTLLTASPSWHGSNCPRHPHSLTWQHSMSAPSILAFETHPRLREKADLFRMGADGRSQPLQFLLLLQKRLLAGRQGSQRSSTTALPDRVQLQVVQRRPSSIHHHLSPKPRPHKTSFVLASNNAAECPESEEVVLT